MLAENLQVDGILALGPFKLGNEDRSTHETAEAAINECPGSENDPADLELTAAIATGDLTSIICQLENSGRVVYLPGPGDPDLAVDGAPQQLTVFSTNAGDCLVEIAPSLFIASNKGDQSAAISSWIDAALDATRPSESAGDGEQSPAVDPALILLETREAIVGTDFPAGVLMHVAFDEPKVDNLELQAPRAIKSDFFQNIFAADNCAAATAAIIEDEIEVNVAATRSILFEKGGKQATAGAGDASGSGGVGSGSSSGGVGGGDGDGASAEAPGGQAKGPKFPLSLSPLWQSGKFVVLDFDVENHGVGGGRWVISAMEELRFDVTRFYYLPEEI